ncbi:hypothetical protein N9W34_05695 [Rickettsiales bacterium]|nr:hypothetical protein [Rickettsiales bacterium]
MSTERHNEQDIELAAPAAQNGDDEYIDLAHGLSQEQQEQLQLSKKQNTSSANIVFLMNKYNNEIIEAEDILSQQREFFAITPKHKDQMQLAAIGLIIAGTPFAVYYGISDLDINIEIASVAIPNIATNISLSAISTLGTANAFRNDIKEKYQDIKQYAADEARDEARDAENQRNAQMWINNHLQMEGLLANYIFSNRRELLGSEDIKRLNIEQRFGESEYLLAAVATKEIIKLKKENPEEDITIDQIKDIIITAAQAKDSLKARGVDDITSQDLDQEISSQLTEIVIDGSKEDAKKPAGSHQKRLEQERDEASLETIQINP